MKLTNAVIAVLLALGSASSFADTRNPFDPASATVNTRTLRALPPPLKALPFLPPPPPPPPQRAARPAEMPKLPEEAVSGKPKEPTMRATAAACQIKVKAESIAAPSHGGIVTIVLQGGARDCVSAVLVREDWLEAQELFDPNAIKLAVDANEASTPRQSDIIIANAGQSVTVTLVQEGRSPRTR
jgi:hypothetical protein